MDCLELMGVFRDFLNFIIPDDVHTKSFKATIKTESGNDSETVEVLWKSPISDQLEKLPVGNICLFQFHEIKELFNQIVNSWFKFKSDLKIVYELYFGVMYNSNLYLTNKFLMISEAIEVYHRQKFDPIGLTNKQKEVYDRIIPYINDIPLVSNDISSEEVEQVKVWMNNGISPYLSTRIMRLYVKYCEIIPFVSLKIGSKKCFALKASKYRNDLTHGNISSEETDDSDLLWTYTDLHILLRLCIYSQLGFTIEKIQSFCNTKGPQNLKERMFHKMKVTIEFLDSNTETAYAWSAALTDRCDLPESKRKDPDSLLDLIEGVQVCIDKERLMDIQEQKQQGYELNEDEILNFPHTDLEKMDEKRKESFFDSIYSINEKHLKLPQRENVGISLALWSGCYSAVKSLSKEENGGPNQEIRGRVFQMIEKLSSERPIFGIGVEVALLWKINHDQSNDVEFKEEVIEPRIKKYEKLYNEKMAKISEIR